MVAANTWNIRASLNTSTAPGDTSRYRRSRRHSNHQASAATSLRTACIHRNARKRQSALSRYAAHGSAGKLSCFRERPSWLSAPGFASPTQLTGCHQGELRWVVLAAGPCLKSATDVLSARSVWGDHVSFLGHLLLWCGILHDVTAHRLRPQRWHPDCRALSRSACSQETTTERQLDAGVLCQV
jgi:hypothetical protein